ncbi:MAG: GAF domain-containing sensor histidine kinase [Flavobacterium sp.]
MPYRNLVSLIPDNDAERLEKLYEYRILDTHSEDTFDKLALMAAQVFNTPSAFIVFIDKERVFLKSNLSELPLTEVDRKHSLASLCILLNEPVVINDTTKEEYLITNPIIALEGGVRFFAGAPLTSPEGFNVGVICVAGNKPQEATKKQLDMLKTLSKIVIDKLENRLRYRKTVESHINMMNIALHEIKNPLASINLANDIMVKDNSTTERMTDMIKSAVSRMQNKLGELLKHAEQDGAEVKLNVEDIDLKKMFDRLVTNFELLAQRKNQTIILDCEEELPPLRADWTKISDVLHNLVSNALKYSYPNSTITIICREDDGEVYIEVKDEGQGLSAEDMEKMFTKFGKLSAKPTGRETSNGLGLSITKSLVELHNGTIMAVSDGKDKGTSFIVRLPQEYRANISLAQMV